MNIFVSTYFLPSGHYAGQHEGLETQFSVLVEDNRVLFVTS